MMKMMKIINQPFTICSFKSHSRSYPLFSYMPNIFINSPSSLFLYKVSVPHSFVVCIHYPRAYMLISAGFSFMELCDHF
jgi:hypothetical protein